MGRERDPDGPVSGAPRAPHSGCPLPDAQRFDGIHLG